MDQPLLANKTTSSTAKGKKSLASNFSGSISSQQKQKSNCCFVCCHCFFPNKDQDDHSDDQDEGTTTPDQNRNSNNPKLSQHAASDFTSNHVSDQVFSSSRPHSENDKERLIAQNLQGEQENVQGNHQNSQLIGKSNDPQITEEERRRSNKSLVNVFASHNGDRQFSNESGNYQGKSHSNSYLFPYQNQQHQIKRDNSHNSPTKTETGGKDSMLDPSKSRRVKFNIRSYFQTQLGGMQAERLTHLFSTCINDEESFLLVKLKDRNFSGITASTSCLNDNTLTNPNVSNNPVDQMMVPLTMSNVNTAGVQNKINFGGINKKSFRSDFNSSFLSIPEQIISSIAIRLKDQFVIDAFCGVGYNTCFFAKEASQIIGIDINAARIALAKHNIEFYKKKVELIQSDFFKLPRLKADVVVLHPDFTRGQDVITQPLSEERIDLITDVQPDLTESLQHAFNIADSVILILHKNCDITQLPLVLDKVNFATKKFTVEIELMNIDRKFSNAVVYLGEIADVKKTEEIEFYLKKLYDSTNFSSPSFEDKLRLLLIHIRERRRISGLAQLVLECEKQVTSPSNRKTLFQEFFDRLNEKKPVRVKSSSHLSSYAGEQENPLDGDIANEDMPKQLLSEIQQIILNSGQSPRRQQPLGSIQKSPSSANLGDDGYMSSFSYNISNSHFHFHPSASHGYQNTSNFLINTNQQAGNNNNNNNPDNRLNSETYLNSNHILDGIDRSNTNGQQQNHHMSALTKDRQSSNNQENQNNLQQNNQYQDDENYGKDTNQQNQDDDDDSEDEEQRKNVYYSCSYNSNALAASEASDSNSIRPQLSNNMYFNGNNNNNHNAGYDRFNSQEDFDITPLGKDANKKMPEMMNRQFSKARTSPGGIRLDGFGSPTDDFFLKQDFQHEHNPEPHDDQGYYDDDLGDYDDDLNERSKGIGKSAASKMTKNHNTFQNQNDFEEPISIRSAKKKDIFTLPSSLGQ